MGVKAAGHCPMGCGETLMFGPGGRVLCFNPPCPEPTAPTRILGDPETEHVVQFTHATFAVRHPLRERLDDALFDCDLYEFIAALPGPPVPPGRYRARQLLPDSWTWEEITGE